ncbi:MAG TPA: IclR family transcriptional regulator [Devosia sp.]|nr:IclR family transcriptional regulator [Devosia sp.]
MSDRDVDLAAGATQERDPGTVGVLFKAFHTLEAMAELGEPVPLRQIATATGLPKGTLFRILQTLCMLGYVGQIEGSNHYYLTSQISHLGRNARQEDIKLLAMPLMKTLHGKFNETINLGILEGLFVYYLAVLEAQRPLAWRVPAGTRDMFYSTALGRAIVAHLKPEVTQALVERANLRSRTVKTIASKAALTRILDDVRTRGVSFDLEENDDGVVCIGTPLFLDGRVIAAISVSVPSSRYTAALGEEIQQSLTALDRQFRTMRGTPLRHGAST